MKKKKPVALAEYAALMGRVAEYLAYERECIAAEQAAQFDALHGGKEKRPSKAELKKAKHELAQAGEPIDEYNVNRQVVKDRAEAAKPSAPPPDILSLGQPLALAQVGGGDPFPKEWERLRGELVDNSDLTDRVCAEIERRHSELVALISGDDNDAAAIADAAQSFKCYLEGIAKPPTTPTPAGYTRNGISQDEFAKWCGVTKRTIRNWENGTRKPPTIFDAKRKTEVVYSAKVRDDCVFAKSFAIQYGGQKRLKRALSSPVEYIEGQTEQANERTRRGYQ